MSRTILVPFDSSPRATLAVTYAAALARSGGGRLLVYWAIPDEALRHHAEQQVARVAEPVGRAGVEVSTGVECRADAAKGILDAARDAGASLIAMVTDVGSDLDRWLRGSVADEVLRQSPVPVLIVPPEVGEMVVRSRTWIGTERQQAAFKASPWPWPAGEKLRVLVPLDGSELAEEALAPARAVAGTGEADLLLMRVVDPPPFAPPPADNAVAGGSPEWLAEAEQYLAAIAGLIEQPRGEVATLVVAGDAATEIAGVAHARGADLIAMATRGRSGLTRQLLGSVATATLQRATVPVLLVPAGWSDRDSGSRAVDPEADATRAR